MRDPKSVRVCRLSRAERTLTLVLAAAICTSTLWLGRDSAFNLVVLAGGGLLVPLSAFAAVRPPVPPRD